MGAIGAKGGASIPPESKQRPSQIHRARVEIGGVGPKSLTTRSGNSTSAADQPTPYDDDYAERLYVNSIARAEADEDGLPPTPPTTSSSAEELPRLDPSQAYPFPTSGDVEEYGDIDRGAGQISIAVAHNDDPWTSDLDDKLGVTQEAYALARLAVSRSFKPPIAVGVFGDWGSGKSYFMRLVHEHAGQLTSPAQELPKSSREQYLENIVQVRFNAWHYAETNLWASLIDHLFTELNAWLKERNSKGAAEGVMDALSTARTLTLQSLHALVQRRQQQKTAAERLTAAQSELEAAKAAAAASSRTHLQVLRAVLEGEQQENAELTERRRAFEHAAQEAGVTDVAEGAAHLVDVSRALTTTAGQLQLTITSLASRFRSKLGVALFVLLVLVAPSLAVAALSLLTESLPLLARINDRLLQLSALMAGVIGWLGLVGHFARRALKRLQVARSALDEAVAQQTAEASANAKREAQRLAALNVAVETAQSNFAAASDRLRTAHADFTSSTGADRLIKFIRSRASDGHYAKHLGLIANIRKDIEELSGAVAGPDAGRSEALSRDRERFRQELSESLEQHRGLLSEDEVAQLEKLQQSIHDAQTNSVGFDRVILYIDDLDRCPPEKVVDVLQAVNLLLTFPIFVVLVAVDVRWVRRSLARHYGTLVSEDGAAEGVTPDDYLEKIFQIPYWVRPMDEASSSEFVRARLGALVQQEFEDRANVELPAQSDVPARGGEAPAAVLLRLTIPEINFMGKLAPHAATSPRRALRFMNTYRLIRASLDDEDRQELLDGGYKALLVQLAIATGAPALMSSWVTHLETSDSESSFPDLDYKHRSRTALRACLAIYEEERVKRGWSDSVASALLARYARTAARYSFAGVAG
jgi:hypothetical protein